MEGVRAPYLGPHGGHAVGGRSGFRATCAPLDTAETPAGDAGRRSTGSADRARGLRGRVCSLANGTPVMT